MIFRSSVFFALIAGFFMFKQVAKAPAFDDKESLIIHGVIQSISKVHFQPKPIDDDFSKFVFKTYIDRLDGGKRYFIQSDIDQMKAFELKIDDQTNDRSMEFFDLSMQLLDKRMKQTEVYYNEIMNGSFDIDKKGLIELDEEKKPFAKDEAQQKEYWREFLTFEVMTKVWRSREDLKDKKEKGEKVEEKSDEELKKDAIVDVKKTFDSWFKRLNKLRRSDRFETYVGSIANYFDPHTDYFSPREKEDFDISMGGKLEGIGARLQQEDDYIKVSTIIVGGPAWKGKELEEGDLILAVAQDGKKAEDITGWRSDDAVQLIRGPKGTKVTLTVKRKDNTIKDISIIRDEVIIDESFARSVIIDIPAMINNVQYIKLPKFYSSFENENGNSCAADIAKELEKARKNNVNGVILDLRNNSGGSLNDVVEMSGLFIEDGPIVQVKAKDTPPYVYNDKDSNVQYNGPLIVMVNTMSASASEILAAALQDYGRAIIVGGNSTFGKGSVQRFFDLDQMMRGNEELKPLGSVKMTVQKFYRINGGSTQLRGVVPDIIFPDNYTYINAGEKEYDNPMQWSEITPQKYNQEVVKIQNMLGIKNRSQARVMANNDFSLIRENAKRLKESKDVTKYPGDIAGYTKAMNELEEKSKKFDQLFKNDIPSLNVRNLAQDKPYLDSDVSRSARNEDWIKGLKKDVYLNETLLIMKDMIETEPSFATLATKIK